MEGDDSYTIPWPVAVIIVLALIGIVYAFAKMMGA